MSKLKPTIELLEKCLDLMAENNIMISVKQTNFYQGNGKSKRHGRFLMDSMEHKILIKKDGYYFFMLMSNRYFIGAKIIKASNLSFKNQISWQQIIELPTDFKNLENFKDG